MLRFLLSLMIIGSAFAAPPVRHFRAIARDVWREGGVCRHAAVAVCAEAAKHNMPCTMPWWDVTDEVGHVIPVIWHPSSKKWHAIDVWRKRGFSPWSKTMDHPPKTCGECEDVSPHGCKKFLGYAEVEDMDRVVSWVQESIYLDLLNPAEFLGAPVDDTLPSK